MAPEGFISQKKLNKGPGANTLAEGFRSLTPETVEHSPVFGNLEEQLSAEGFVLADASALPEVFNNNSLVCRSESFDRVMCFLLEGRPLEIHNSRGDANMCLMSGGEGYKVAMLEGFSGKEVNGVVKVVLTFRGDHLQTRVPVPRDSELWNTKPKTALVSLVGDGLVLPEDVVMVSFRFPVRLFPERLLTEEEQERLEIAGIDFVVRHYLPEQTKTTH